MTRQHNSKLVLGNFLPYQLSVVTNKISTAFALLYSNRFDLSVHEWRVMAVLGQRPGISADEVCRETGMEKVPVSRAVGKLLDKKLVHREFSRQDRRRSILTLTDAGHAMYEQIVPLARNFQHSLEKSMTSDEFSDFIKLLDKLAGFRVDSR